MIGTKSLDYPFNDRPIGEEHPIFAKDILPIYGQNHQSNQDIILVSKIKKDSKVSLQLYYGES